MALVQELGVGTDKQDKRFHFHQVMEMFSTFLGEGGYRGVYILGLSLYTLRCTFYCLLCYTSIKQTTVPSSSS